MVAFRSFLLALLLGLAGSATTHRGWSANVVSKLFLQVQNATKSDIARIDTAVSNYAEGSRFKNLRKEFDASWRNNLVIIPCLIVGSPLIYIWYKLEHELNGPNSGRKDEIFTAVDADLREVEIARVGASGVCLLRRMCDRHTGIMFAFTGIMLQTIFLYFIAVGCITRIEHEAFAGTSGDPTPVALIFCSLFCNTLTCCASLILGVKCWATKPPEGYQDLHNALVLLDSFIIPSVCTVVGALYLCTSNGISSLVFSSTSMAFICSINAQIAGLMSWSLSGHGGRAFQPANVSIKDAENSTLYAHYSFVASFIVAFVTLPLGWILGVI